MMKITMLLHCLVAQLIFRTSVAEVVSSNGLSIPGLPLNWVERAAAGKMLISRDAPEDGYAPSIGNGTRSYCVCETLLAILHTARVFLMCSNNTLYSVVFCPVCAVGHQREASICSLLLTAVWGGMFIAELINSLTCYRVAKH